MPRNGPSFQDHHNIEQQTLKNSELLDALSQERLFEMDAPGNRIFLPSDPELAHTLGITPHSGGPLSDYQFGIRSQLDRMERTADGRAALAGDPEALERVAAKVAQMRDTIRAGLVNGELHTNTPLGVSPSDIRPRVQSFFGGLDDYGQRHSQQIQGFKTLPQSELGWSSIVHSESRIVSTLQYAGQVDNNLIRGGDADVGRQSLSQALADAHGAGRLSLSEASIRQVESTLGAEATAPLRIPPGQRGFATMELLADELSTSAVLRSGGLLTMGADMALTAQRAGQLLEQDNLRAAQSEVSHAVARGAGGVVGGMSAASVVGASGALPTALVVGDAMLMAKAFDKGVTMVENHGIYHQADRQGVAWEFTGRNWQRDGAIDRTPDGINNPTEERIGATYEKARELGYAATARATELALGKVPPPQEPFNLPAREGDRVGIDNQNWRRNPESQEWTRSVKTGVEGANDRGTYREEIATPERGAELNREAIGRIQDNIANGREAIASAYVENYAAQRSHNFGNVPDAVQAALPNANAVTGSDKEVYQRNETGVWASAGKVAEGNLALELELTREARQPSLEQHNRTLATLEARPAPTPEQSQQNELLHRYRVAGTELNPEWQQAIEQATQRTREAQGLTAPGVTQLLPNETGQFVADSPIAHFERGADGVNRLVATTSTQDIRESLDEVRGIGQPQRQEPTTLAAVSVSAPRSGRKESPQEGDDAQPVAARAQVLADNPSHPDFGTFNLIHDWARGTGQWDEEKSRNVASALYKEQLADPLVKRVNKVVGGVGQDGAENAFAVYAPFGDKPPMFHAHVDGREASQQPAQQNLEQAEQIKQQQVQQQQVELQQQRDNPVAKGPQMTM